MGNKNHDGETRLQFWIDVELLKKLDIKLKQENYKSRTEWFREQVRKYVYVKEGKLK